MVKYVSGGLLLLVAAGVFLSWYTGTERLYKTLVNSELNAVNEHHAIIVEEDILALPVPLQAYMRNAGVVGSPRVNYFKVAMEGQMKTALDGKFSPISMEQYTFIESGKRLFFLSMPVNGLRIKGIHCYNSDEAFMRIKLLDLFKVVDNSGRLMQKAETVTYFNDLCIMAPGALIEEDIEWETLDSRTVRGTLKKYDHKVSAIITFNTNGMIENFYSEDRLFFDNDGNYECIPWSTPISRYGTFGEYYLPSKGSAIWHYSDMDFNYMTMDVVEIKVNH